MEKFLVRGLKRVDSLEKGYKYDEDEFSDKKEDEKTIKNLKFSSMLFDPSLKSEFKNKFNLNDLEQKLKKLKFKDSARKRSVINFILNLNKFFSDSEKYNFTKDLVKISDKDIIDSFADENISDILKDYRDKFNNFKRKWDTNKVPKKIKDLEDYIL